ncbi:polyunsaturated fatty acid lipoxygenase ALOX15B isoform X2 [Alosa pseudoharengus]|uniref:polyunsaturated fatty acid lipoxygenase ALOX15B isoform X2 n=1 Tax=Alosa pseudoharengus TaxID=34774 RepID=UPI003F8A0EB3
MEGYHVTIRTAAPALAGSYSILHVSLISIQGRIVSAVLDAESHLLPGSACTILMGGSDNVEQVALVRLRLEVRPGFPELDWHCQTVEVNHGPQVQVFPCHRWLRAADGDVELRCEDACLLNMEALQVLIGHRAQELSTRQQHIRWQTFAEGVPHCVDMQSLQPLGPNLSYTRQSPGTNLHYLKGFAERKEPWRSFKEIECLFLHNGSGNPVAMYVWSHWREDAFFGHQCLNGCNPLLVRQIRCIPANLSVTPELVQPFLPEGSSLELELETGKVFLLDYEVLEGVPPNIINGKQQHFTAPLCLLHAGPDGTLKPIAIQLQQKPATENPVFLPSDPQPDWLLAKMWTRCADFQCHQLISHFLRTHLLGEVCCIATLRQLPEVHPIHRLLMPHVRSSLQINIQARASLLAPNGVFDRAIGCGLKAIPVLLAHAMARLRYDTLCVPEDLKARGLDSLPNCYYAQDALKVWNALNRFVTKWVDVYYHSNTEVQEDSELQSWIKEIFTKGFLGKAESGMPQSFESKEELSKFITMVIFSSSALHAAVNFSQLDFNLWMPNCPASMSRPPPQSKGLVREDDLMTFLPEVNATCSVLTTLTLLSQPAANFVPLCQYREPYFSNGAHYRLVKEVQSDLRAIAEEISERNSKMELPYPYLSPLLIENSVAI